MKCGEDFEMEFGNDISENKVSGKILSSEHVPETWAKNSSNIGASDMVD